MREPARRLCAIGLSFIAAAAAAQPAADAADRYPVNHAAVSGTELAYVEAGAGVPVILVHGAFSDYRYWAPQLAARPDGVRIVAYSRRDFHPVYPPARAAEPRLAAFRAFLAEEAEAVEG